MKNKIKGFVLNHYTEFFMIYFCTLFIDTTALIVDYPFLERITQIIRYVVYVLMFLRLMCIIPEYKKQIIETKWKEKDSYIKFLYFILVVIIISLIINFFVTKSKRMLFLVLILLSAYDTDYKKLIKTTMKLQIILTTILVTLCVTKITQNYIVGRAGTKVARYSLGFQYPTNLAQMVMFSSILYIYMEGIKIKWKDIFTIYLINILIYAITDSRTEFIVLVITLIFTVLFKYLNYKNKNELIQGIKEKYSLFFTNTFVIYPFCSFILVMQYSLGEMGEKINSILSNRLKQTYDNVIIYGLKPFGEKIEFLGLGLKQKLEYGKYKSNFVDNEYLQIMFSYGYIFAICFVIILTLLLIMLYKKRKYREIMLCSIYLLFGLLNPRISSVLYCPILFMLIPTIVEYKELKKEKIGMEKDGKKKCSEELSV